jgi:hypothetical protein
VVNGGGTLTLSGVTTAFTNGFTLAALNVTGGTVSLANNLTTSGLALSFTGTTINGPGTITNAAGQTWSIRTVTFNTDLINQGTLITDGASTVTATNAFTAAAGSTLRLQATGSTGNSTFTAPPFTNSGAIELTTTTATYTDVLNVSGTGVLTNAAGGTITSLVGTGGSRTLGVQLDNQGLVTINQPLTLSRASAAHTNSGTIDGTAGDFTVTQSGTTPSFTNTGTLTVGAGRTATITNGAFTQGGVVNGGGTLTLTTVTTAFTNGFTLAALNVTNGSVSLANNLTTSGLALSFTGTTINGPGTITNAAGQTWNIRTVTFNTDLINQGTLITDGTSTVAATNAFTAAAGSTLRLQATGSTGNSTFTAPPFTNNGLIELTTTVAAYTTTLAVSGTGILTNAPSGTISLLLGTGGSRNFTGNLVNTGTLSFQVGGTAFNSGYTRLAVTGTVTLGGSSNVSLVNAFVPLSGNTFTVLTSTGALTGTFGTNTLAGGLTGPTYPANSVVVSMP